MSAIFGRSFESQFGMVGGAAFRLWAADVENIEPVDLRSGMNKIKKKAFTKAQKGESVFPPNLPEFLVACSAVVEDPSHRLFLAAPDNSKLRFKGKKRLATLREQLKR